DTLLGTLNFKVLDNCTSGEIRVGLNQDFSADNPYGLAAGKKNLISLSDESALSNMDFTQTATSMVVSVGVILDKTEVLVDGINGATVQASAFNTNLEDITADEVVWSVSPTNDTGVHLGTNKAGEIVVDANAAPGRYCVTAAKDSAFNGENTASAYFTVTRAPSVAQSMVISYDS